MSFKTDSKIEVVRQSASRSGQRVLAHVREHHKVASGGRIDRLRRAEPGAERVRRRAVGERRDPEIIRLEVATRPRRRAEQRQPGAARPGHRHRGGEGLRRGHPEVVGDQELQL